MSSQSSPKVPKMVSWPENWRFCIFYLNFNQFFPFLHVRVLLRPMYAFQSPFLVLLCLHNHFFHPFMDLQCFKWKIGLKIVEFVFLTLILHTFCPFCMFESSYDPPIPFKVYVWYFFVCTTIFSIHLWICIVPNGKLASKLAIFSLLTSILSIFGQICIFIIPLINIHYEMYIF